MGSGSEYNVSSISACLHAGTHCDAPLHVIDGGKGIDRLGLSAFIGPARVVAVDCAGQIQAADLTRFAPQPGERILIKTRNSGRLASGIFDPDYCALSTGAAECLADAGVLLLGIDSLSVGSGRTNPSVHRLLLGGGVSVLEGINLSGVEEGGYFLSAAPVKVAGADGAPARAVLIRF